MRNVDVRYVDDWEALYVDGVLYEQGHHINWHAVLEELFAKVNVTFVSEEVQLPLDFSDDTHYVHFEDRIEEISVGRYDE